MIPLGSIHHFPVPFFTGTVSSIYQQNQTSRNSRETGDVWNMKSGNVVISPSMNSILTGIVIGIFYVVIILVVYRPQ